jgi:hypothetical protein
MAGAEQIVAKRALYGAKAIERIVAVIVERLFDALSPLRW